MDVLSTTMGRVDWDAVKAAVRNPDLTRFTINTDAKSFPPITKLTVTLGNPFGKRKPRSRLEQIGERVGEFGEAIFEIGEVIGATMAIYGPMAARQLGWVEAPKEKRTAPRVAAGVVIGAGAVYFLEPRGGPERRERVLGLIG
jgi:hypothetical protein